MPECVTNRQPAIQWQQYRVALRNIPEQDGFPFEVTWPQQPGEFTGK
ncbi:phage tail assembly chaperone [Celerinatantimonas diazotrophica]|nr:phage tail assembly chaperone [Celerinatantimonas diazotrophica]